MTLKSPLNKMWWVFLIAVCLVPVGIETKRSEMKAKTKGKDGKQKPLVDVKLILEISLKNDTNDVLTGVVNNATTLAVDTREEEDRKEESNEDTSKQEETEDSSKWDVEERKEESNEDMSKQEETEDSSEWHVEERKEESNEDRSKQEETEDSSAWDVEETTVNPIPIEKHPSWKLVESPHVPCGVSRVARRIIGGLNAGLGRHPWVARLGRFTFYNGQYKGVVDWFCAGVLINTFYILTAAHCSRDPDFRMIRLGEYDANRAMDCNVNECSEIPQDYTPQHIVTHPDFTDSTTVTPHDLSLVRLSTRAVYNGWVAPVCLPKTNIASLNVGFAEAIGWGKTTSNTKSLTAVLQSVKLPIVRGSECMKGQFEVPNPGTFCAGGKKHEDTCSGDSGGPLLKILDETMKYYVIGIVSFGPIACGDGHQAAYTNVSYHLRWILDSIKYY